jgi:hypothetical protein
MTATQSNYTAWRNSQNQRQVIGSSNQYGTAVSTTSNTTNDVNMIASSQTDQYWLAACASGYIARGQYNSTAVNEVLSGNHADVGSSAFNEIEVRPGGVALATSSNRKLISSNNSYGTWSAHITNPINDVLNTTIEHIHYEEISNTWFIGKNGVLWYSTNLSTWTEMAVPAAGEIRRSGPYLYIDNFKDSSFYASFEGGPFKYYKNMGADSVYKDETGINVQLHTLMGNYYDSVYLLYGLCTNYRTVNSNDQVVSTVGLYKLNVRSGSSILKSISNKAEVG